MLMHKTHWRSIGNLWQIIHWRNRQKWTAIKAAFFSRMTRLRLADRNQARTPAGSMQEKMAQIFAKKDPIL